VRAALEGKLEGLYGHDGDERAFDALAFDKQQSLLIFARRLGVLNLWQPVARIENVYGEGGVGMNFSADDRLAARLLARDDFTRLWAAHRQSGANGFRERRRTRAALHFLYKGEGRERVWSVHFDLYNPLASPVNAWRHLFREHLRGATPDWRAIAAALDDEPG
jgi:hypothetical protein